MEPTFITKQESISVKGLGVLLILLHHLFAANPEYSINIFNYNVLFKVATIAKSGVALFLILSGFGLTESVKNKNNGLFEFYFKTLKKFYVTYWIIYSIFVPISIFIFKNYPNLVWRNSNTFNVPTWVKMSTEFLGVHIYFFGHGYNPTWWYVSLIIGLYLLFPFFYVLIKRFKWIPLIFAFLLFYSNITIGVFGFAWMNVWIFPFCLGIYLSVINNEKNVKLFNEFIQNKWLVLVVVPVSTFFMVYVRYNSIVLKNEKADSIIALFIIIYCIYLLRNISMFNNIMHFYGVISFEIFLIHTFIFYYWFNSFIYSFKKPIIIYLVLLAILSVLGCFLHKLCDKVHLIINMNNHKKPKKRILDITF